MFAFLLTGRLFFRRDHPDLGLARIDMNDNPKIFMLWVGFLGIELTRI